MEVTKEMLAAVVQLQGAALRAGSEKLAGKDSKADEVANVLAARIPREYLGKGLVTISPAWEVSTGDTHLGFYRNVDVKGDDDGNRARRIALQAAIRSPSKGGTAGGKGGQDL